jgi:hypothetical protein
VLGIAEDAGGGGGASGAGGADGGACTAGAALALGAGGTSAFGLKAGISVTAGRAMVGWTLAAYGTLLPNGETLVMVEQPHNAVAVIIKTAPERQNDVEIRFDIMANPSRLTHL